MSVEVIATTTTRESTMRLFLFLLVPLALSGCGASSDASSALSSAITCSAAGRESDDLYCCFSYEKGSDAGACGRRARAARECDENEVFVAGQLGPVEGVCAPSATMTGRQAETTEATSL
jgi:hypothetical protein